MISKRPRLKLVPLGDPQKFQDFLIMQEESWTLRDLLTHAPALSKEPIDESLLDYCLDKLAIDVTKEPLDKPLYRLLGMSIQVVASAKASSSEATSEVTQLSSEDSQPKKQESSNTDKDSLQPTNKLPTDVSEDDAVHLAYARDIEGAASFLRAGLSILIVCDKLVVQYLWSKIAQKASLNTVLLDVPVEDEGGLMPRGLRQRQLASLKQKIKALKEGDVLVLPHLDLLAGGSDSNLPTESRELTELVYEESDRLLLAFADRSLEIPEVLAARFSVRLLITGVDREVQYPNGDTKLLGKALITAKEAARFQGYDPEDLYKNVAGMNPVRIRHALKYAEEYARDKSGDEVCPIEDLYQALRAFKVQTSANFEVPNVSFDDIGGYESVKAELLRAIQLMTGVYNLPNEELRQELIPRGFIFHGPPGTGKTLFAKAIANQLNATIQVVSGPEVTDMYVGESERKVRELFAEARRNAPAVMVFDEFDSIATKRSGREDGGSRAGNALVAQMLTEMDGFRPDVPMLVIGTTNRLDIIDEALLRPSRFKPIAIGLPSPTARRAIAAVQAKHFDIEISSELLEVIASATEGMSGDDIKSLFRDACVGQHCENPPIPPDAKRFGMLVGRLRQAKEQQSAKNPEQRAFGRQRPGEVQTTHFVTLTPPTQDTQPMTIEVQSPPEPSEMIDLTPTAPVTTEESASD